MEDDNDDQEIIHKDEATEKKLELPMNSWQSIVFYK